MVSRLAAVEQSRTEQSRLTSARRRALSLASLLAAKLAFRERASVLPLPRAKDIEWCRRASVIEVAGISAAASLAASRRREEQAPEQLTDAWPGQASTDKAGILICMGATWASWRSRSRRRSRIGGWPSRRSSRT